jgi:hypothetical protein
MTWLFPRPDQPHIRSPREATAPRSRLRVGAQEDKTILGGRLFRPWPFAVRPPGSARTDEVLEDLKIRSTVYRQEDFMAAPSMTTPAVTYFHSATSSFRAKATMVVFLRRPPLRVTRSLNHRASADCG